MNKVLIPKQSDGKTEKEEDDRERWRHFKVMPTEEARRNSSLDLAEACASPVPVFRL